MVSCADSIKRVLSDDGGILSWTEIISRVYERHPDRPWKECVIRSHLVGCSVNHPSTKHYPDYPKFLYTVNAATVRLYDPLTDRISASRPKVQSAKERSSSSVGFPREPAAKNSEYMNDLEEYLAGNLDVLENGLRIYEKGGVCGIQFPVDDGVVDILAQDVHGRLTVIEVCPGRARYIVLSQVLGYMSCLRDMFPCQKYSIRGFIVASAFDDRLKMALAGTSHIKLVAYRHAYSFSHLDRSDPWNAPPAARHIADADPNPF